jgi:hypothetical protein
MISFLRIAGAVAIAAGVAALPALPAAASTPAASHAWDRPRAIQGPRDITHSGIFTGLACASASDCTAVGSYTGPAGRYRDFAITERQGTWGQPVTFTAPIASKKIFFGELPVLACSTAGNCAAADDYHTFSQAGDFVISETNGTWGHARQVPARVEAIACPAPGDCTATLNNGDLLSEHHGTWRTAFPAPGLAALRGTNPADFGQIVCPSLGNCSAGGTIDGNDADDRAFVLTETNGVWGNAQLIKSRPGTAQEMTALSCSSAGHCTVGGYSYPPGGSGFSGFAATQVHGTWRAAVSLPGTAKLDTGIGELTCPAPGDCSALGSFGGGTTAKLFVSVEQNGTWHEAQTIPGNGSASDWLTCPAVGHCILATAILVHGNPQAATAEEVNGHWERPTVLPGIVSQDHGKPSALEALSCPEKSRCTAVGSAGELLLGGLFSTTEN